MNYKGYGLQWSCLTSGSFLTFQNLGLSGKTKEIHRRISELRIEDCMFWVCSRNPARLTATFYAGCDYEVMRLHLCVVKDFNFLPISENNLVFI